MIPIKQALLGRSFQGFKVREHENCVIEISGGYVLTTETLLRYVGKDGAFITIEDHLQQFGLPSPIDAETEIGTKIKGKKIIDVSVDLNTGDLRFQLTDGLLEILCSSSGYEQFQVHGPDSIMIGMGGKQTTEPAGADNGDKSPRLT